MVERFVQGLKLAGRSLLRTPRFTIIAVFTIALGMGADTAIFSVVNGVLLKDLAFPRSDELVNVWSTAPGLGYQRFELSPDVYFFYKTQAPAFASIALYETQGASVTGNGEPERLDALTATWSLFPTLGVAPLLGRTYTADEDVPGAPQVAVISHELWQRRYGGDPKVLGRTITVDGTLREIIGVMPARFDFPRHIQLWLPARFDPGDPMVATFSFDAVGRLAPGVSAEDAQAQLVPLVRRFHDTRVHDDDYRAFLENGRYAPLVHSMKEDLVGDLRRPLWILLGTVGFVLLIACANVANLVLIRSDARRRESAVRSALGATRGVLVRHTAMEAIILAAAGGAIGLAAAWLGVPAILRYAPPQLPRLDEVGMDGLVLLFALGTTAASALLFGVLPVLRQSPPMLLSALRQGGRGGTGGPARQRSRNLLVAGQTALALVLLVGSGLLIQSFRQVLNTDLGFDYHNLITFRVSLPEGRYPTPTTLSAFYEDALARLRAILGVESAALGSSVPLSESPLATSFDIQDQPTEPGKVPPILRYKYVSPGFAKTLGIRVVAGRTFTDADEHDGVGHVLVDRALAAQVWPGQDAVGKRLRQSGDTARWYTVEGVVANTSERGIRQAPEPLVYFPLRNPAGDNGWGVRTATYVVRGKNVAALASSIRSAVWNVNRDVAVADMRTGDELVTTSVVQLSFTMFTLGIAAFLALVLGAVGLYGVLSYSVAQRTREIGVRLALGAGRRSLMRMVVGDGARITVLGMLVGLAGAAGLTRLLRGILFDVEPLDATTFVGMSIVLMAVGVLSAWLPARRAATLDPMESMRVD